MRPEPSALTLVLTLSLLTLLWPSLPPALTFAIVLMVLGGDAALARRDAALTGARTLGRSLPVNVRATVSLELHNPGPRRAELELLDELPAEATLESPFPLRVTLEPGARGRVSYELTPTRRGDVTFGRLVALRRSPLGFWRRRVVLAGASGTRVYPDFARIAGYLDMLAEQQTVQLGIRRMPRRGEGLEFHQLREYRSGDSIRQIDWKATGRRQSLISREYQEERDQRLLFLIDSGRRMRARDGTLSHFDHALNAMLLLAYVALRQGDTVALKFFGHDERWVPGQRGVAGINVLLNSSYDLQTGTEAADLLTAANDVMTRQRKRSLVVLLTNLQEVDDDLAPALELLRRRHLVVIGNLRERALDEAAAQVPESFDEALVVAGAHQHLEARRAQQQLLASLSQVVVDSTPQELPVAVVNAYWRVKRSGML